MHDADTGGNDLERVERLHAPFQKLVTLAVPVEFHLQILFQRVGGTRKVHLHRVVHHQIHRHQRFDDFGVFAHPGGGGAHRRQIHQQRHAGEILQHDARHNKGNFRRAGLNRLPVRQRADRRLAHAFAVAIAEHGFEHEPDGNRQPGNRPDPGLFQLRQRVKPALPAIAQVKCLQRVE